MQKNPATSRLSCTEKLKSRGYPAPKNLNFDHIYILLHFSIRFLCTEKPRGFAAPKNPDHFLTTFVPLLEKKVVRKLEVFMHRKTGKVGYFWQKPSTFPQLNRFCCTEKPRSDHMTTFFSIINVKNVKNTIY